MQFATYTMIFLGSALMIFNICGFIRFAQKVKTQEKGFVKAQNAVLYIPIALLVMFLLGYLAVGIFGHPDLIVSGILFGGSIFVFIMYILLEQILKRLSASKKTEAKLMAAEESNRVKTAFLSDMSHEMRTPLNIILGLDTMALKDSKLTAETRERIEKIGSSANYLLGLINNILDINSIDTGEFSAKNEDFSLPDIVNQIDIIAKLYCKEKNLKYISTVSDTSGGLFFGDSMRFKQILICLLSNVIKYTESSGTVEFSAECRDEEDERSSLSFRVTSTGSGIDREVLPTVFDESPNEDLNETIGYAGSGLGFPAIKKLVTMFGGTILPESLENTAFAFTVDLPVTRIRADDALYESVSLEGKRILIAEDIDDNAEIVADLLELEGAKSERAENGKITVEMFRAHDPGYFDVILMDLRMPEMDGLTACKEIRKTDRKDAKTIPIIALTANAFESDVKESLDAGMNLHLAKPTDCEKLYSAIKKVLYDAGQDRETT